MEKDKEEQVEKVEEESEEALEIENAEGYFHQAADELDPKQLASRQWAHEMKVANFKAGGKF